MIEAGVIARLKLANRHAGLAVCANLEDRHAKDDVDAWTKGRFLEGQVAACVSYEWRIILLVVGRAGLGFLEDWRSRCVQPIPF